MRRLAGLDDVDHAAQLVSGQLIDVEAQLPLLLIGHGLALFSGHHARGARSVRQLFHGVEARHRLQGGRRGARWRNGAVVLYALLLTAGPEQKTETPLS